MDLLKSTRKHIIRYRSGNQISMLHSLVIRLAPFHTSNDQNKWPTQNKDNMH